MRGGGGRRRLRYRRGRQMSRRWRRRKSKEKCGTEGETGPRKREEGEMIERVRTRVL